MAGVLSQRLAAQRAPARFWAILLPAFAFLALLLAGLGVYALTYSYLGERRREFGIRVAVGASSSSIIGTTMLRIVSIAVPAVATGLLVSLLAWRFLGGILYGLRPSDPATYAAAAALVILVAMAAAYLPTARASRPDISSVLRSE